MNNPILRQALAGGQPQPEKPLRIVTFNYNPWAFEHVRAWIVKNNHKQVLAVTTPGPKSRPTPSYTEVVEAAPRNVDVLVSTRMKTVVTPIVRALQPDLIICFSFPYRLSAELCAIPRLGAVNLHPSPLPAYRGPNVNRIIYDGNRMGAALHWVSEEFDTGNVLSVKSVALPEVTSMETIYGAVSDIIHAVLDEGMPLAIAGDPGQVQDESKASYAAEFSEEDHWIDIDDSMRRLEQKMWALSNTYAGDACHKPNITIEGKCYVVTGIEPLPDVDSDAAVGSCLERDCSSIVVKVRDGVVRFLLAESRGIFGRNLAIIPNYYQ